MLLVKALVGPRLVGGGGGGGGGAKRWHNLFFMHKAQTFTSPGFVITQSFLYL